jgi:hypothetical protein
MWKILNPVQIGDNDGQQVQVLLIEDVRFRSGSSSLSSRRAVVLAGTK